METPRPKVGIAVIIERNNKVLLGKRKGSHGEGSWAFPGGHLEFNENIEDCAKREVMEETGLTITNIRKDTFTNDIMKEENKHYITCFVRADCNNGEPKIMEPDKCEEWGWFDWNNLPNPLFIPLQNLLNESNPSKYLLLSIKESKKTKKEKDYYSFENNKKAIEFLDE